MVTKTDTINQINTESKKRREESLSKLFRDTHSLKGELEARVTTGEKKEAILLVRGLLYSGSDPNDHYVLDIKIEKQSDNITKSGIEFPKSAELTEFLNAVQFISNYFIVDNLPSNLNIEYNVRK